ncbi:MAG: phosphoribosyltransferase family protein [Bacteroidetes bacterium]|nr:phosphoribosyltransferase family protein [Bacteroidota bacterium]
MGDVLTKVTNTETQTKKTKLERWQNVEDSFRIVKPTALYKKNVLLVDDVITTGATLSALCDQMVKCDPESITVGALATGVT